MLAQGQREGAKNRCHPAMAPIKYSIVLSIDYLAVSSARVSRITLTLTWPG
jgi:hypothetical protein